MLSSSTLRRCGLVFLVGALVVFALGGCAQQKPAEKPAQEAPKEAKPAEEGQAKQPGEKITVGYSVKTLLGSAWFEALRRATEEEAKKLGIELIQIDAQGNSDKQVKDVQDLITKGVDVLIIDPAHPTASLAALDAAEAAHIPVVNFNTAFDLQDKQYSVLKTVITCDNYTIGYNAGAEVAKIYGKPQAKAVILAGAEGDIEGWQRRCGMVSGFVETMVTKAGRCNLEVLAMKYCDWGPDLGQKNMEDFLVKYPQIDVVFAEADCMALGAVNAMKEAGRMNILIASVDGQREALEVILNDGPIKAVGVNSARFLGQTAAQMAAKVGRGESVPTRIIVPSPTITKENVKQYYDPNVPFL